MSGCVWTKASSRWSLSVPFPLRNMLLLIIVAPRHSEPRHSPSAPWGQSFCPSSMSLDLGTEFTTYWLRLGACFPIETLLNKKTVFKKNPTVSFNFLILIWNPPPMSWLKTGCSENDESQDHYLAHRFLNCVSQNVLKHIHGRSRNVTSSVAA